MKGKVHQWLIGHSPPVSWSLIPLIRCYWFIQGIDSPLLCLISAGVRTAELKTRVEKEKRARPRGGGLSGTGEDGWIIELGADRRFVHWDWAWTSLDWAFQKWQNQNVSHRFINRCRMKDQVQDSSQIDLPSHLRVRQGMKSNVRCSISRLLKKLD